MKTICSDLGKVSQWFKIGIQLGIPRHVLKQFEEEDDPLSAVVDYWLKGNVTKSTTPVSWKSIVAALEAESVEEKALAESISKKYCQPQDSKVEEGWCKNITFLNWGRG